MVVESRPQGGQLGRCGCSSEACLVMPSAAWVGAHGLRLPVCDDVQHISACLLLEEVVQQVRRETARVQTAGQPLRSDCRH